MLRESFAVPNTVREFRTQLGGIAIESSGAPGVIKLRGTTLVTVQARERRTQLRSSAIEGSGAPDVIKARGSTVVTGAL
eukprot:9904033-Alexandrium_andersonii.AAC.1